MSTSLPDQPIPSALASAQADEETMLRARLGLRPTRYAKWSEHPDASPCPSWCWVTQGDGLQQHEIDPRHPLRALHHVETVVSIVASLYPGATTPDVDDHHIRAATIESDLTQAGSADPVVTIYLHSWQEGRQTHEKKLELTIEDARELGLVLSHLVQLAVGPQEPCPGQTPSRPRS